MFIFFGFVLLATVLISGDEYGICVRMAASVMYSELEQQRSRRHKMSVRWSELPFRGVIIANFFEETLRR